MQIISRMLKTAGILLAGALAGTALLSLAFLIPVSETNKSASYAVIEKEGWYPAIPMVSASLDTYFHSFLPGVLDDSTDSIMLHTALDPQEKNVLRAAMDMNGYDYYWHGYVALLRPLLAVFDYGEIRVLNQMGQFLLVGLLALFLYRRKGILYSLLALTSYFLLMPLAMPFSLQFSWVFYITAVFLLYLTAGAEDRELSGMKLFLIFMAVGMLTSFLDLLTYPLYTWGVPVIWWLLLQKADKKPWHYVREVIYTGLWWIAGYAGMWLSKGCLGGLILGRNIFARAFYEVGFRLGVENTESFHLSDRLDALYVNWKHYEYKLFVILLAAWLLFFVAATLRNGVQGNVKSKALALAGVSSIVWYFALANHTAGHHFFTYRIYGIAVLAVLAILLGSIGSSQSLDGRRRLGLLCIWGCLGIIGGGLSLLAREDISVTNGEWEYGQMQVREGEVCEMSFTPSFSTVKQIGLCISTTAQEGICRLVLADGDKTLYEEQIPLDAYENKTYAAIPVTWKLSRGKTYRMSIYVEQTDTAVSLLTTTDQNMPLSEYGLIETDGALRNGQILSGLTYSYRPLSHFTLFFLTMTWIGILFATYAVLMREKA